MSLVAGATLLNGIGHLAPRLNSDSLTVWSVVRVCSFRDEHPHIPSSSKDYQAAACPLFGN